MIVILMIFNLHLANLGDCNDDVPHLLSFRTQTSPGYDECPAVILWKDEALLYYWSSEWKKHCWIIQIFCNWSVENAPQHRHAVLYRGPYHLYPHVCYGYRLYFPLLTFLEGFQHFRCMKLCLHPSLDYFFLKYIKFDMYWMRTSCTVLSWFIWY